MKYYWQHYKEDKERGFREGWYLTLSFATFPSSAWLYQLSNKDWWFRIYDTKRRIDIDFKGFTKREAMKRCVATLKALNETENGKRLTYNNLQNRKRKNER